MRIPGLFCVLALLCQTSFAFPVRITGRVLEKDTRLPAVGVTVFLRSNPIARTDSAGVFSHEADLDMDFPVQLFLEAQGYSMARATGTVTSGTLDFGDIFMESLREKSVSFCGTVWDSLAMEPMARISVSFRRHLGNVGEIPDATTDSLGGFCQNILLSNNPDGRVFWNIFVHGYYSKGGEVDSSNETAPLAIRMRPYGTIFIEVRGRVVDSATSQPIPGAMIVLATNYHYAKPDTSYTGEDGSFRRMVQGGTSTSEIPGVYCILQAENYQTGGRPINFLVSRSEFDFGQMALVRSPASLGPGFPRPVPAIHTLRMRFDANGRRMPSGPPRKGTSSAENVRSFSNGIAEPTGFVDDKAGIR
jgi:hypothetical protein